MPRHNALTFLSGRLISLVVLLCFQVVLVRVLPPAQFGPYALVFALATLMQTVVSFGIPRVISKYVGRAGWSLPNRAVRTLFLRAMAVRVGGSALLIAATALTAFFLDDLGQDDPRLIWSAALFIIVGVVQIDSDTAAQSLSLQKVSRSCMVGEAILRLLLVAGGASLGLIHRASDVLLISLFTASLATGRLLFAVLRHLSAPDLDSATETLERKDLIATGLSGYASSMAWFASSPAIIRLLAGHMLSVVPFAGFAFTQGLVVSFQRYTPGALLFPFVEPAVMRAYAKTQDKTQLEAALSLVSKMDIIVIGAAITGTIIAARPLVELLTGGRYGEFAYAIPWLLGYVVAMPIYRSFEIVAILLGASATLVRTLWISIFWIAVAIFLTPHVGLIALLACPVGDAVTRLCFMFGALRQVGIRDAVDRRVLAFAVVAVAVLGIAGSELAILWGNRPFVTIAIGTFGGLAYLAVMLAIRPIRQSEAALISGGSQNILARRLRDFARA